MLACRLCLRLGIDDPEQWLEDVPDRVYSLWDAYSQIEPWWSEREMLAQLVGLVRMMLAGKYSEENVEKALRNADMLAASYMPPDWVDRPEIKPMSLEETESILAARFG